MILNTIADLQALPTIPSDNHAHVLGYNTPADGGGGDFYWDAASAEPENFGTVFNGVPTTSNGRWRRYYSESINLKWFGAVGDGATNDSPALQKMIDYCEPAGVKDVIIPFGKFYLEESVYVRIGGIKFIGQGSLLREDSNGQTYVNNDDVYNGSVLIVKNDVSGIVYDTTVTDSVYWRGVSFRSENGRSVGNTYAIDFRSTYVGPTWPFNVHECHFAGFNRVFNFDGDDLLYNVASIDITHCAFVDNDEVIYQGFKGNDRYSCWGLNFKNNKAHWNSRVIYGCFGKDLVTISDNNFEGNNNYADGTPPPYSVDIETYNCAVIFHGNHFEGQDDGMVSDCVSISSLAKNADGSYKSTDVGAAPYVDIYGNNFDGINTIFKPYTLTGCIVRINESINGAMGNVYVHQCEILENSRALIYLTDYAKEYGTIIKFTNPESLSSGFINSVNSYGTGLDNNTKGFLIDGEQWARTSRSGFGLGSGHAFKGDVKYCIATFKMRNNNAYSPASSAYCKFTKDGTTNPDYYVHGSLLPPVGESIAVCIFPAEGVFTSTSDNVFSVGLGSAYNNTTGDTTDIEYCSSVFMYTTMESNPLIIPVFEPTNVIDDSNGTFIKGQTFFNGTEYKIVTESGTMVTNFFWSPTIYFVTAISGNKIQLNGTYDFFTQGQYIEIDSATYRIIELKGLWATLDRVPAFTTTGLTIDFHTPTFSTLIDDNNVDDYAILNQNVSAQTANAWISGDFTADGNITATTYKMPDGSAMGGDNSAWGFYNSTTGALPVKVGSLTISDDYVNNAPTNGIFSKGDVIIKSSGLQLKRDLVDQTGRRNWGMSTENNVVGDWTLSVSTSNTGTPSNTVISALSTGDVGIGIASPAQKLDVDGTIRQSSVTSAMLKANGSGDIVAAVAGTDYANPADIETGTYNPTITGSDTYTASKFLYTKVKDHVHVSGHVDVTLSGPTANHSFVIDLPISANITVEDDLTGTVSGTFSSYYLLSILSNFIEGNVASDKATVHFVSGETTKVYVQFDYIIQ